MRGVEARSSCSAVSVGIGAINGHTREESRGLEVCIVGFTLEVREHWCLVDVGLHSLAKRIVRAGVAALYLREVLLFCIQGHHLNVLRLIVDHWLLNVLFTALDLALTLNLSQWLLVVQQGHGGWVSTLELMPHLDLQLATVLLCLLPLWTLAGGHSQFTMQLDPVGCEVSSYRLTELLLCFKRCVVHFFLQNGNRSLDLGLLLGGLVALLRLLSFLTFVFYLGLGLAP